jgi:RNA polymerase sigma factor (sigma-70 family)
MESTSRIETLTAEYKAGNTASFEELYHLLAPSVFAYISHRTATRELAKDATQDSFVELSKALTQFTYQSDPAFYAFVFTIVRRQLAKQYAHTAKHAHVHDEILETLADAHVSRETTLSVQVALEELDECSREIIVLHHWSRYTFGEIATILHMTESAVRVRHHRARATLANLLTS